MHSTGKLLLRTISLCLQLEKCDEFLLENCIVNSFYLNSECAVQ